jgi:hypothetical protein
MCGLPNSNIELHRGAGVNVINVGVQVTLGSFGFVTA